MPQGCKEIGLFVTALSMVAFPALSRAGDHPGDGILFRAKEMKEGSSVFEKLLYRVQVDHESGKTVPWGSRDVELDGSRIMLYFKSVHLATGYRVCFRWGFFKEDGKKEGHRYGCFKWFDQKIHSLAILSPEEAERIGTFVLHSYDVRGEGDWDGSGDPPGLLAHEYASYSFVRNIDITPEDDAPPQPDYSARIREIEKQVADAEFEHRNALFLVQMASYQAAIPGGDLTPMFQAQSEVRAALSRLSSLRTELGRLKVEQSRVERERQSGNAHSSSRGTGDSGGGIPTPFMPPMEMYPVAPPMVAPSGGGGNAMRSYLCQKCQENVASACRHMNDPHMLGTTAAGFASLCAKGCWNECQ